MIPNSQPTVLQQATENLVSMVTDRSGAYQIASSIYRLTTDPIQTLMLILAMHDCSAC